MLIDKTYAHKEDGKPYSRYYRDFPYLAELSKHFKDAAELEFCWDRYMTPAEFLGMAKTSTQVQRAIKNKGEEFVGKVILHYATLHQQTDGKVKVPYVTQLYIARGIE